MESSRHRCMIVTRGFKVPTEFLFDRSLLIVSSGPGRVFRYAYSNNAEHSIKRKILEGCWPAIYIGGRASLLRRRLDDGHTSDWIQAKCGWVDQYLLPIWELPPI